MSAHRNGNARSMLMGGGEMGRYLANCGLIGEVIMDISYLYGME